MAKPEWGIKRKCLNCSSKFYDLLKNPVVCPKCNTIYDTANIVSKIKIKSKVQDKNKKNNSKGDQTIINQIPDNLLDQDIEISETENILEIENETNDIIEINKDEENQTIDNDNNFDNDLDLEIDNESKPKEKNHNEDDVV